MRKAQNDRRFSKALLLAFGIILSGLFSLNLIQKIIGSRVACEYTANSNFQEENEEFARIASLPEEEINISVTAQKGEILCKKFIVTESVNLHLEINRPVEIVFPNGENILIKESRNLFFEKHGEYRFQTLFSFFRPNLYEFSIKALDGNNADLGGSQEEKSADTVNKIPELNSEQSSDNNPDSAGEASVSSISAWLYENKTIPFVPADLFPERQDPYLVQTLNEAFRVLEGKGYPVTTVSVSLLEFGDDGSYLYAGIRDLEQKFPASIVKLFWIVALYGKYDANLIDERERLDIEDEYLMVHESSNDAASKIVDLVTGTSSGGNLKGEELENWIDARYSINHFFQSGNYQWLNVSQKVFPIDHLQMNQPIGRDSQIRNQKLNNDETLFEVSRNFLTTFETLRLLYEIEVGKAVSNDYSYRIKEFLLHDNSYESWRTEPFNSIEGFFGEYLPDRIQLMTKVGYTQNYGRQEAAIIYDPKSQKKFLLVVFANDTEFSSEDNKALSEMAEVVFDALVDRN